MRMEILAPGDELTDENWLDALDDMEREFVLRYVETMDVKNSAIAAGYERTTAMVKADGWVSRSSCTKPHVRAAIDFDLKRRETETLLTRDMVIRRLKAIAFFDPRSALSWRSQTIVDRDEADTLEGNDGVVTIREITTNSITLYGSAEISDEAAAAIKEIKQNADGGITLKFHDSNKALEMLGKYLGLLDEGLRVKCHDGGQLAITHEHTAKQAADAWAAMKDAD